MRPSTPMKIGPGTLLLGLLVFFAGSVPLLDLMGFLGPGNRWHVKPWLAWIFALIFPSAGLWLIFSSLHQMYKNRTAYFEHASQIFLSLMLISFLSASAIFLTWQAIAPFGEWQTTFSFGGIQFHTMQKLDSLITRAAVVIAAILIDFLCLFILYGVIVQLLIKLQILKGNSNA